MTEPTLREVMQQVQSILEQVRDLVREVRSDYVRKDVAAATNTATDARIRELEKDVTTEREARKKVEDAQAAFRRQIMAGVLVGVLVAIIVGVLTISRLPGLGA